MPEQVDEGSTDRLFDGEHVDEVVQGRHFAGNGADPNVLRAVNEDVVLDLADGPAPLIRYEWRNQAGETMVVEAAWPFDERQSSEFGAPNGRRDPVSNNRTRAERRYGT